MLHKILIYILICVLPAFADSGLGGRGGLGTPPGAKVEESDGDPSFLFSKIIFGPGEVTKVGSHAHITTQPNAALDAAYWQTAGDQTLLTGDKSGSFDLTTTGILKVGQIDDSSDLISIDPNNRYLKDSGGSIIFNWETSTLYDTLGVSSIDTDNRYLYDALGNLAIDWSADGSISLDNNDLTTTGTITGILSGSAGSNVLLLDTSNDPLTGNLEISKADPEFRLTDTGNSEYARLLKTDTTNYAYQYNRILMPTGETLALQFNGTDEAVTCPTNMYTGAQADAGLTMNCWIKGTYSAYGAREPIMGGINSGGNTWYSSGGLDISSTEIRATCYDGAYQYATANHTFSDDTWHMLTLVINPPIGQIQIWVDGVNSGFDSFDGSGMLNPVSFGIGKIDKTVIQYFPGLIDEVCVWKRTLANTDITDLYNSGSGLHASIADTFPTSGTSIGTDIVAIWHFNEGSGNPSDYSGNSYTGTLVNMDASNYVAGKVAAAGEANEITIWSSRDGISTNEKGIQTFGDVAGRTVLEGLTTRFNVAGTEKGQLSSTGLTWIDNFKEYFGTASDASIYYDGTNLVIDPKEVGTGVVNLNGGGLTTTGTVTIGDGTTGALDVTGLTADVSFFDDDLVGDTDDGHYIYIRRHANEGDDYFTLGIDQYRNPSIRVNASPLLVTGGVYGTNFYVLSSGANANDIGVGRNAIEANWGIAQDADNYLVGAVAGDMVLRLIDTAKTMHFGFGSGATSPTVSMANGSTTVNGTLDLTGLTADVEMFKDVDIAGASDGKYLRIYRYSTDDGSTIYSSWYIDAGESQNMYTNSSTLIIKPATSGYIYLSDVGANVLIGSTWMSSDNPWLRQYGQLTSTAIKYIQSEIDEATDYYKLTREDANILGFDIQMPLVTDAILAGDKISLTQTDGNEYIDSLADGYTDIGATTAIRLNSARTTVTGDLYVGNNADVDPAIVFDGDTSDGQITWDEDNSIFNISDALKINSSTVAIDDILDEDNMASDSATALCTQQSIKKYVDDNAGGCSFGTEGQIPYTNAATDDFDYGELDYASPILGITAVDPEFRLTDSGNSEYTRWVRSDTLNQTNLYSRTKTYGVGSDEQHGVVFNTSATPRTYYGGFRITIGGLAGVIGTVTKHGTCTATTSYIKSAAGAVLDSQAFVGNVATHNYAVSAATDYRIEASSGGANYTVYYKAAIPSGCPIAGTNITWAAASIDGVDQANNPLNILSLTFTPSGTVVERNLIEIKDNVADYSAGLLTLGGYTGTSGTENVYEGLTHTLNLLGVQKEQLTSSGHSHIDNWKDLYGTADDSSITFNGSGLVIQSDEVTATDYLKLRGGTNGIDFFIGATEQITLTDGKLAPTTDNDIDLGDSTHEYKDVHAKTVRAKHYAADDTAPVADGTYTTGLGTATNGTITIKDGIITAVQECTDA